MELTRAIEIVEALINGHDPYTGVLFEQDSVFQRADTVRALTIALSALKSKLRNEDRQRRLPENAGKPWTEEETARLVAAFDSGTNLLVIAKDHERTQGGIRSKLVQLGKLQF